MMKFAACLLCAGLSTVAIGQEVPNASLPETLVFRVYPDNFSGRRGHQVDITNMKLAGKSVTGRITMYGLGQDKCRITGQPAEGMFEGGKLTLKAKLDAGDNVTCPMSFEIVLGENNRFEGRFNNGPYAGQVKPD